MRRAKRAAIGADRDDWTRKAFEAAADRVKDLIGVEGPLRPDTPIGRLVKEEWGWIVSSAVFAWIFTRTEQATSEGWNPERTIGATGLDPDPRMVGAVNSILPKLFEALPDFDWNEPIGDWPKDDVVEFLTAGFRLINEALQARDVVEDRVVGKVTNPNVVARQINAAAGNGFLTKDELNDAPPF